MLASPCEFLNKPLKITPAPIRKISSSPCEFLHMALKGFIIISKIFKELDKINYCLCMTCRKQISFKLRIRLGKNDIMGTLEEFFKKILEFFDMHIKRSRNFGSKGKILKIVVWKYRKRFYWLPGTFFRFRTFCIFFSIMKYFVADWRRHIQTKIWPQPHFVLQGQKKKTKQYFILLFKSAFISILK